MDENLDPVGGRHDAEDRKHKEDPEIEEGGSPACGPEWRAQQGGRSKVGRADDEERHPVEPKCFAGV